MCYACCNIFLLLFLNRLLLEDCDFQNVYLAFKFSCTISTFEKLCVEASHNTGTQLPTRVTSSGAQVVVDALFSFFLIYFTM